MANEPAEHPSNGTDRAHTDVAALAHRLALRLAGAGVRWPSVAAAARAARGVTKLDRARFAAEIDVSESVIEQVEAGEVPPQQVPRSLHRRMRLAVGDLAERDDPEPPPATTP